MEGFDNFRRIAMLFTGAFLVSIGIIAFLNLEVQSRTNHGVKMKNENLFEILGRKVSEMITTLKEKNSYRRSLLYHLFIPKNTERSSMRKLQYFKNEPSSNKKKLEDDIIQTHHRMRHEDRIKKITKLFIDEKKNSDINNSPFGTKKVIRGYDDNFETVTTNNETTFANSGMTKKILKNGFEVHENCYTTNDVLEIIAITCLVNFIFWFLIIFCVNVCTKKQTMWKFNSIESLTSISSGSEYESNQLHPQADDNFPRIKNSHLLKNYVNSLTHKRERGQQNEEVQEFFLLEENSSDEKLNGEKCIHQRFIHLSNFFFDTISLDNLRPVKKKNLVAHEKTSKIVNSFSMEDLIF